MSQSEVEILWVREGLRKIGLGADAAYSPAFCLLPSAMCVCMCVHVSVVYVCVSVCTCECGVCVCVCVYM